MSIVDKFIKNYTDSNKERIKKIVDEIDALAPKYRKYKDSDITSESLKLKSRLQNGESKESIMVDAFALCREAILRRQKMFAYKVQLEAAVSMQDNVVAEMKTGEGKTLVQVFCAYLNALSGEGVHVLTANDYLAQRDKELNESVFNLLGLTCGIVKPKGVMSRDDKRREYQSDIVYSTPSTIVFDYLDDNKVTSPKDRVQSKGFNYAIIDEVDSLLLDDATTPLITSSTNAFNEYSSSKAIKELYRWGTDLVANINCRVHEHEETSDMTYGSDMAVVFRNTGNVFFSEKLYKLIEQTCSKDKNGKVDENEFALKTDILEKCILAKYYYQNGKQYILQDSDKRKGFKEVLLVDESTGRVLKGRRIQNGYHEAIEAYEDMKAIKERLGYRVEIQEESLTTGLCTYPDFVRKYKSGICGMTGTSDASEFSEIYDGLPTYVVDSRKPNIRIDREDELYATKNAKYKAIVEDIVRKHQTGQPILLGVTSVEESEELSRLLANAGIRHTVLNAKQDANEAGIISHAGEFGAVTIATNMAGRGTDIKLGEGVSKLGGLYVISCTRNKNERIDNQLRGRAARQGDPGETKFYVSLEDEIVTSKVGEKLSQIQHKIYGNKKIDSSVLKKLVISCQKSREINDKAQRLQSEKYNSVLSVQKDAVYDYRNILLDATNLGQVLIQTITTYITDLVNNYSRNEVINKIGHLVNLDKLYSSSNKTKVINDIIDELTTKLSVVMKDPNYKEEVLPKLLKVIDSNWFLELTALSYERDDCRFAAYASKDPYDEYEKNCALSFIDMLMTIKNEVLTYSLNPTITYGKYEVNSDIAEEGVKL